MTLTDEQIKGMNWDKNNNAQKIEVEWHKNETEQIHRENVANAIFKNLLPNDKVLDAGCGSGEVYKYLKPLLEQKNASYMGIDGSMEFLKLSRSKFPDTQFELQNLYGLTLSNDSFDVVYCIDVLQHCNYYEQAIKELLRVTKRVLLIRTWVHGKKEDNLSFDNEFYNNIYSKDKLIKFLKTLSSNVKEKGEGLLVIKK
jgi:ubiquinone/menaquinone biosynthesis C-methylase UbiE